MLWELEAIKSRGAINKLVLIVPPLDEELLINRFEGICEVVEELHQIHPHIVSKEALVIGFNDEGQPFIVTSDFRKEGDYYEAIRHLELGKR